MCYAYLHYKPHSTVLQLFVLNSHMYFKEIKKKNVFMNYWRIYIPSRTFKFLCNICIHPEKISFILLVQFLLETGFLSLSFIWTCMLLHICPFFFCSAVFHCIHMPQIIYSTDSYLCYFYLLAILNKAAMNDVRVPWWSNFFWLCT